MIYNFVLFSPVGIVHRSPSEDEIQKSVGFSHIRKIPHRPPFISVGVVNLQGVIMLFKFYLFYINSSLFMIEGIYISYPLSAVNLVSFVPPRRISGEIFVGKDL
jgi:hypothetical protein